MANLSIREAVKHFDVSRPTLTKALKSGKVSGSQDDKGQWSIDPAELTRTYKARSGGENNSPVNLSMKNTPDLVDLYDFRDRLAAAELRAVTAETRADAAEVLAKERAERIEDLRRLLPAPPSTERRRWWPWS